MDRAKLERVILSKNLLLVSKVPTHLCKSLHRLNLNCFVHVVGFVTVRHNALFIDSDRST